MCLRVIMCYLQGQEVNSGFLLFWRHGLRNVALPAITLQFAAFSELFGGAVLAEQVFSYPGLGQATVEAGLRGDVPLLLGLVIFSTIFVFVGNLMADLIYFVLDPRMREEQNDMIPNFIKKIVHRFPLNRRQTNDINNY